MNPIIIKFLKSLSKEERKDCFNQKPTEKTIGKPIPSPRSWEIVDNILSMGIRDEVVLFQMISGAIGKDTATKFCTFREKETSNDLLSAFLGKTNFNVALLNETELYDVCSQFVLLVKNSFFNNSLGLIYKKVGEFLLFLIRFRKPFFELIANQIDISDENLQHILKLFKSETNIDIEDIILKEAI